MKTATVQDLRNRFLSLQRWLEAGEEIGITRRGKLIARLVPENQVPPGKIREKKVDWTKSAAFRWDRSGETRLTAEESADLLNENKGRW